MIPERLGPYRFGRMLGEGGMGIVYEASDERLGRQVAIKLIRGDTGDDPGQQRKRLWREARTAAQVNHPNLCQLHDIVEQDGNLFLVMELLQGRPLSDDLKQGPIELAEAVRIMRGILEALKELHRLGIIHRDLKPSNVFIGPHGVKVLDFGLAQGSLQSEAVDRTLSVLTMAEATAGTPHYMPPEQIQGAPPNAASDLFSAGCIFYELLTAKKAFPGTGVGQVLYAVLNERPPALSGSVAVARADSIIRRALEKKPADRFSSAGQMLDALADVDGSPAGPSVREHKTQRLIVLPFRLLRPDPETEFLAFSLPDAITCSLTGLDSIVIRSAMVGSGYDSAPLDLKRIASEFDVDAVLVGTLLRAGNAIRVTAQLIEVGGGTVLWSEATQTTLGDIFQLQDQMVERIVRSLTVPLTAQEQRILKRDVPSSAFAYECYLRANQLMGYKNKEQLDLAKDLYLRCLQEDPNYAPAWARLGRLYRLASKFVAPDQPEALGLAEDAFRRAFELNPDLAIAHHYYTGLETDSGRSIQAIQRLLGRAHSMQNDPNLFAGLGHACRYCGLLDASAAALERTWQIDPKLPTSASWTYLAMGRFESALEVSYDGFSRAAALIGLGRTDEAIVEIRPLMDTFASEGLISLHLKVLLAFAEGDRQACLTANEGLLSILTDPEALFTPVRYFAHFGEERLALETLARVIDAGYWCSPQLRERPEFAALRGNPRFTQLVELAESRRQEARKIFIACGGLKVLKMQSVA
jgi:serine/threonine protein kinase/tetratricopeptide (TPR) repeat protein